MLIRFEDHPGNHKGLFLRDFLPFHSVSPLDYDDDHEFMVMYVFCLFSFFLFCLSALIRRSTSFVSFCLKRFCALIIDQRLYFLTSLLAFVKAISCLSLPGEASFCLFLF